MNISERFKNLIPPLASDELAQLEENIIADGCRDPLVTWNGTLIDGHNRFEICTRNGIDFKIVEKEFPDESAAMLWIIDNQKGRRNMSNYDKGLLAMEKQRLLRPVADKSYQDNVGRPNKSSAKLPTISKIDTRREAAQEAGIGERTLDAVKLVKDAIDKGEIDSEIEDAIRQKKTSVSRVAKEIREKRNPQPPQNNPVRDALQYVNMAISQLERIRDDDPSAKEELERAARWIANKLNQLD